VLQNVIFFICGSSREYIFAFPFSSFPFNRDQIGSKHTKNLLAGIRLVSWQKKVDFLAVSVNVSINVSVSNLRFLEVGGTLRVVEGIHLLVHLVGYNLHHPVHKHWYYIQDRRFHY